MGQLSGELAAHFNGEADDWGNSASLGEDIADLQIPEFSNFLDILKNQARCRASRRRSWARRWGSTASRGSYSPSLPTASSAPIKLPGLAPMAAPCVSMSTIWRAR
jgi:hypothetical protein